MPPHNKIIWGSNLTFKIPDNTSQTPCRLNIDKMADETIKPIAIQVTTKLI